MMLMENDLIKSKKLLLLMLLKGLKIDSLMRIVYILLKPANYILRKLFSPRMINIYAVGMSIYCIKLLSPSILEFFKIIFDSRQRRLYDLRRAIAKASTSGVWKDMAKQYVELNKQINNTRNKKVITVYDKLLLQQALHYIQSHTNIQDTMNNLRFELVRNVANIAKNNLHEHYMVIPNTILKYVTAINGQLREVYESKDVNLEEKKKFFKDVRQIYGRTALLLSGGASFGTFHLGVVKALFEHGLLPRIISGTSAGSMVAALVCVRTDDELKTAFLHLDKLDLSFFDNNESFKLVKNLLQKGYCYDSEVLIQKIQGIIGEYTFGEAFERTGRVLNITVCAANTNESPKVLNHINSPDIFIWSAVAASAAFPGLFPSQYLYGKSKNGNAIQICGTKRKWIDGAMEMDLPISSLSEVFNCNYFIVSQCAPHAAPLLSLKKMMNPQFGQMLEDEIKHRCKQMYHFVKSKWLKFFTQTWEGDVTITLPLTSYNPHKIISNPTIKDIYNMVKIGERCAWQHLWTIDCNCSIEAYLDECVKKLVDEEKNASWGLHGENQDISLNDIYSQEIRKIIEDDYSLNYIAI
jgi:TAG lipase/steryl ester hydrolase/phospholipase A2/LPA acyltransferase